MKKTVLIILFLLPISLIGQKKDLALAEMELWTTSGIMPLEKGIAFYGKTQLNLVEIFGIDLSFGYGFANPVKYYGDLPSKHTEGSFISTGVYYKTIDVKRGKSRKLNLISACSIVLGKGKESAKYKFLGKDFGDYVSTETYSQKYKFSCLQISLGMSYRVNEKLKVELNSYIITPPEKKYIGEQYFKIYENYSYSYSGFSSTLGVNIGVGYLLWKPKSKR